MNQTAYVRIVCEGKLTEPYYFQGMLRKYGWANGKVIQPKDHSPVGIVREAKRLYKQAKKAKIPAKNIHVWAVFDRDGHANLKQAIQDAQANNIKVAFNSVCFEYFILLHFEKCTRPFANCTEVIGYLKEKYDQDYTKRADHYQILKDQLQTAVDNNHWLLSNHLQYEDTIGTAIADRNPFTDTYRLLKFLTGLKDPAERQAEAKKVQAENYAQAYQNQHQPTEEE